VCVCKFMWIRINLPLCDEGKECSGYTSYYDGKVECGPALLLSYLTFYASPIPISHSPSSPSTPLSFSTNPSFPLLLPCPSSLFPLPIFFADPENFRMQEMHCIALLCTYRHPHFSPHSDAPQITNRPSNPNITLSIGATRTITVTYSQGRPPASVEWRKDGVLIAGPAISTSSSETTLTLTNSGPDVQGRYNLAVFNVGGSDTFVYNVKVECELMHGMGGVGVTSGLHEK